MVFASMIVISDLKLLDIANMFEKDICNFLSETL